MFMSLKLLKLHGRIFFWTVTGRMKKLKSRLKIDSETRNPKKFLIVFPMDESSFRVAQYSFRDLGKNEEPKRDYIFLVGKQFEGLFHLQMGDTYFIQPAEVNSKLSDEQAILQFLDKKKFDIIVDLNPEFHLGITRLISTLISDMKVGFTSPVSDWFYNIQLDISKSGIMEKGFKQINLILAK